MSQKAQIVLNRATPAWERNVSRGRARFAPMLLAAICLAPAIAEAADTPTDPVAEENALAWGAEYRADVISNASGGLRRATTVLGNLDFKVNVDLDRALLWRGGSFFVHTIASDGGKPNARNVGSGQGIDNIEVNTNTAKIFQAWLQQTFFDERLSLLVGLYDLNSEFYATPSSGPFLHPAPGIGSELAQTGRNGPSVFPTSSVGFRARFRILPSLYVQGIALDGVPGDPSNPHGTHIEFNPGDGALGVVEIGHADGDRRDSNAPALRAKYALGAWSYTSSFPDLIDVDAAGRPVQRSGNRGFYALADWVYHERLAAFVRTGVANAEVNRYAQCADAGVTYSGLIPGRPDDQLGLATSLARNGDKFLRAAMVAHGVPADRLEADVEITYRAPVTPWLTIQPDVQWVINPGTEVELKDAIVFGVRFDLTFGK